MQYYNNSTNTVYQSLPDYATPETCRDYGYWPIYDVPFTEDPRYYTYGQAYIEFDSYSQTYTRRWEATPLPLDIIKAEKRKDFDAAFAEIDNKSPRSARGLILSLIDGSFPTGLMLAETFSLTPQQAPTLTPEEEQRIIDVGIMWELEEVANTNRDAWHKLLALAVTDEMTLEEAQAVLMQAMEIKPWIPWKEIQKVAIQEIL